jgi:hypothetical protein
MRVAWPLCPNELLWCATGTVLDRGNEGPVCHAQLVGMQADLAHGQDELSCCLPAPHSWAFKIGIEARCSDDGEPSGTAGRPILSAIEHSDMDAVCVLVVRQVLEGVLISW